MICVSLTVLAPARLVYCLLSVGESLPTSDSWRPFVFIIGPALEGVYPWKNFFKDVFINGHLQAFTVLWQIFLSYFFHYDISAVLLFGVLLSLVKLALLFDALSLSLTGLKKWLLLPVLSFLIFGVGLLSTFEFDWNTLMEGTSQLGFVLGLWGLVRFRNSWKSIALACVGGLLASWSSGSGPLAWPVYFLALLLYGIRDKRYYLSLIGMGTLVVFPYIFFIFIRPSSDLNTSVHALPGLHFFLESIGLPLAKEFFSSSSFHVGIAGVALASLLFAEWLWRVWQGKGIPRESLPAVLVLLYGSLTLLQIGFLRGSLVPWYAFFFMPFWWGAVGLLFALQEGSEAKYRNRGGPRVLSYLHCFALAGLVYLIYASNLDASNKSFFLRNRSPVAASCLRNYRLAPTYCEENLFVWGAGSLAEFQGLGIELEKDHLSVFSPHQRWSLQGDFVLPTVKRNESHGIPGIFWASGLETEGVSLFDYRRLSLFLHSPNSIEWSVSLPANAKSVVFKAGLGMSNKATKSPKADGMVFQIGIKEKNGAENVILSQYLPPAQKDWIPIEADLTRFKGADITIVLQSDPLRNFFDDWGMLKDPHIELTLPESRTLENTTHDVRPSNTDLYAGPLGPSPEDFDLGPLDSRDWSVSDAVPEGETAWKLGENPKFTYTKPLDICLADYASFAVEVQGPSSLPMGVLKFSVGLGDHGEKEVTRNITLLGDGNLHEYTYDLRLLEESRDVRLKGISLMVPGNAGAELRISKVRLVKRQVALGECH